MSGNTKLDYTKHIETYPGFPKAGVVYFDFTPILQEPKIFRQAVADIRSHFSLKQITKVACIEAKGFTIGAAVAYEMEKPLVLIRKPELVPGEVDVEKFEKEYGFAEYQLKKGQLSNSDQVLIIYDIMAGPGATRAAANLVQRTGARVAGCAFVIELAYLNGREHLTEFDLFSLAVVTEDPR